LFQFKETGFSESAYERLAQKVDKRNSLRITFIESWITLAESFEPEVVAMFPLDSDGKQVAGQGFRPREITPLPSLLNRA